MGIHINGRVQGMIVGDGRTVEMRDGRIVSVDGRDWQARYDAAIRAGIPASLADWWAGLAAHNDADARQMFREAYGVELP
jgi:hypothetical protein